MVANILGTFKIEMSMICAILTMENFREKEERRGSEC
jgi:hypothetical protein